MTKRWILRLMIVPMLFALSGCPSVPTSPVSAPPPGSWLVFLCKASDIPTEPQSVSFYSQMFARGTPDLLWDYFDKVSSQRLDVSGSRVFGWFTLPVTEAEILQRNNSAPVTRSKTAQDCRTAAAVGLARQGLTVDPSQYVGVISIINMAADAGQAGSRDVVATHAQAAVEIGFYVHEMLHVLGLPHSRRSATDSTPNHVWGDAAGQEYQDCWDMMSFRTCVFGFNTIRGFQGPGLNGANLERLGWLPRTNIQEIGVAGPPTTVTLSALNTPGPAGIRMARIEVPNRGWYIVEYREPTGFDRGAQGPAVLIREQRSQRTAIIHRSNGRIDWQVGEEFVDPGNFTSIRVDRMGAGTAQITVNTASSRGGLPVGATCGDKWRGAVGTCTSPATCGPRVIPGNPPLWTVDYFCQ